MNKQLSDLLKQYVEEQTHSFQDFDHLEINSVGLEGETLLHMACTRDATETENALLLIKAGADVNARDDIGQTPLHRAVFRDNLEIVRCLLENGADVSAATQFGGTAISMVKKRVSNERRAAILELLEEYSRRQSASQ